MKKIFGISLAVFLSGCATTKPQGNLKGAIDLSKTDEQPSKYWINSPKKKITLPKHLKAHKILKGGLCLKIKMDIDSEGNSRNMRLIKSWPEKANKNPKRYLQVAKYSFNWKPSENNVNKHPIKNVVTFYTTYPQEIEKQLEALEAKDPDIRLKLCH